MQNVLNSGLIADVTQSIFLYSFFVATHSN